jgi:predicted nucleic acid-binding protein
MNLIVDANILFSALITPNGKLAQILAHPTLPISKISSHFLITELFKHQDKIVQLSKKTPESVSEDLYYYLKSIHLYDETFIEDRHWKEADRLTIGVDSFDINYVALALQTNGWLWTGDKKLAVHLNKMNFDRVLNTNELYKRLEKNEF